MSEMLREGSKSVFVDQVTPPSVDFHKPPHAAPIQIIFELFGSKAMQFNLPEPPPLPGITPGPMNDQLAAAVFIPCLYPSAFLNFRCSLKSISGLGKFPLGKVRCFINASHRLNCSYPPSSAFSPSVLPHSLSFQYSLNAFCTSQKVTFFSAGRFCRLG